MRLFKSLFLSLLLLPLCRGTAPGAVFFIGIDGADNLVIDGLLEAGRMPNLASVIKDGVRGELVTLSPPPLSSPVIWTNMATGVGPGKHGITGFVKPGKAGWFRTGDRKAPALWNMVSSRKKTAGVAGYLMTYPAEPVNGVMVSNNYFMPVGTHSVVYPTGLALGTSRAYAFETGSAVRLAAGIAGFSPPEMFPFMPSLDTYDSEDFRAHYIFEKLSEYAQADEGFARLGVELLDRGGFDLFMVYLPGVDRVSHLAWGNYEAAKTGGGGPFGGLVPSYYAYTDGLIGRLLAKAGAEDTVVIASDHGFMARAGAGPLAVVSGDHRPGGFFAAKGPSLKRGARLKKALADWDVAPTVLYLLGLPAARNMDGALAAEIFSEGVLKARPQESVAAYPATAAAGDMPDLPFTPQELERLRLSGYVQ